MRLSVVIVNYNTGGYLNACLESITQKFGSAQYEVVESFPRTRLIKSGKVKPLVLLEKSGSYLLYFKKHHAGFKSACLRAMFGVGVRCGWHFTA